MKATVNTCTVLLFNLKNIYCSNARPSQNKEIPDKKNLPNDVCVSSAEKAKQILPMKRKR